MTAVRQNGHGIRLVHDLPEGSARGCAPLPLATGTITCTLPILNTLLLSLPVFLAHLFRLTLIDYS